MTLYTLKYFRETLVRLLYEYIRISTHSFEQQTNLAIIASKMIITFSNTGYWLYA